MKRLLWTILLLLPLFSTSLFAEEASKESVSKATVLKFKGSIGPASVGFLKKGFKEAKKENSDFFVFQLNTPGGLATSMRDMIELMLASPIPVVVYVSPEGARAASAGTYIVYASNIAAMAPGTHLGSATPVQMSSPLGGGEDKSKEKNKDKSNEKDAMQQKILEDAKAYIRSLAELRGRNVKWGEKAVTKGASISAQEALKLKVINLIAKDVPDLMKQIHGKTVEVAGKTIKLNSEKAEIKEVEMDWRNKLLQTITNPNVAYILLLVGIYGLFFEFMSPGTIIPGVIGGICLLLALYSLSLLPLNYAGAGLMLLGIALMAAEAFSPGFGVMGIGGVISFAIGSVFLLDRDIPDFHISLPVVLGVTALTTAFFIGMTQMVIRAHKRPSVSGEGALIGQKTTIVKNVQGDLQVHLQGEAWDVISEDKLKEGQEVEIIRVDGLVLKVRVCVH